MSHLPVKYIKSNVRQETLGEKTEDQNSQTYNQPQSHTVSQAHDFLSYFSLTKKDISIEFIGNSPPYY